MGKVQPAVAQNNPNRKLRIRRDTSATNLGLSLPPPLPPPTLKPPGGSGGRSVAAHSVHFTSRDTDEAVRHWLTVTTSCDGPLPRGSSRPHGSLVTSSGNDRAVMQPSNYDRIMTGWSFGDVEQAAPCGTPRSTARAQQRRTERDRTAFQSFHIPLRQETESQIYFE